METLAGTGSHDSAKVLTPDSISKVVWLKLFVQNKQTVLKVIGNKDLDRIYGVYKIFSPCKSC